jgi:uracil-DNA glycosylase family protein
MKVAQIKIIPATEFIPKRPSLTALREAAQHCQGCPLYLRATQAVIGEGPRRASIFFVGEQPGNDEDLAGYPFVGPAGKIFDRALIDAGIDRRTTFVTNAVKHFKFEERGKRRIHKKPAISEVKACRPWLDAEIALVKPAIVVCLGAIAAASMFGPAYRVTKQRAKFIQIAPHRVATSTIHPSAILRAPHSDARHAAYTEFVADLKKIARAAG